MAQRPSSRSNRLFKVIVGLYPRPFRRQYGAEMIQIFHDIQHDAAHQPHGALLVGRALTDAIVGAGLEHLSALKQAITHKDTSMQSTFIYRHRLALGLTIAGLASIATLSLFTGFWGYNGPIALARRIIANGVAEERVAVKPASDGVEVTAHFVGDYVQAKYYGDTRQDVGFRSRHAYRITFDIGGRKQTQTLEDAVKGAYAHTEPGFDPLTCSSQAPIGVRYTGQSFYGHGLANTIVAFSYPNQAEPNLVQYDLKLDTNSRTKNGLPEWKVMNITCLSLQAHTSRPYTTPVEAARAAYLQALTGADRQRFLSDGPYDQHNDRSFGPANNAKGAKNQAVNP